MPLIKYTEYKPETDTARIIKQAVEMLEAYAADGYEITLRQLYYRFIAQDLFPDSWQDPRANNSKNTEANYKRLGTIISKAREAGMVDWHHIQDRGRAVSQLPHWESAYQFLSSVTPQFHVDLWSNQPCRVEVWVEKDALSDVISQACRPLDVPNFACKGYASSSSIWEAAHNRMLLEYAQAGQDTVILHLGDHDPSGMDMTRDIQDRLSLFATRYRETQKAADIEVKRIALNMDQIEEYEPPPNPAKISDPRADKYIEKYGRISWELDALEPSVLVALIQEHIRDHMDQEKFDAREAFKDEQRTMLEDIKDHWSEVQGFLRDEH